VTPGEIIEARSSDWSKGRKRDRYAASDIKTQSDVSDNVYYSNLSELSVAKYMRYRGYSCSTDFSMYMQDRKNQWDKDVVCDSPILILYNDTVVKCDSTIIVKSQTRSMYEWAKQRASWIFQRKYQNRSADPLLQKLQDNQLFCGVLINDKALQVVCTLLFYYWPSIGFLIREDDPLAEPIAKKLCGNKKALYLDRVEVEPVKVLGAES